MGPRTTCRSSTSTTRRSRSRTSAGRSFQSSTSSESGHSRTYRAFIESSTRKRTSFSDLLSRLLHRLAHLAAGFAEVSLDVAAGALIGAFVFEKRVAEGAAEFLFHRTARLVDVAF